MNYYFSYIDLYVCVHAHTCEMLAIVCVYMYMYMKCIMSPLNCEKKWLGTAQRTCGQTSKMRATFRFPMSGQKSYCFGIPKYIYCLC